MDVKVSATSNPNKDYLST